MKRIPTATGGLFLLGLLFLLGGCRRAPAGNPDVFRFLDHLESQNVVRMPPASPATEKIPALRDLGISADLAEVKKKVIFQDLALNAILAPPESEFRFEVFIPEKGTLEFGFGVLEKSWDSLSKGVEFKVALRQEGAETIPLLVETLAPAQVKEHRKLFKQRIDLAEYAGQKIIISLLTQAAETREKPSKSVTDLAFWFNPVIYSQRSGVDSRDETGCNIILISLDTLRWDRLGCYGFEKDISPNIDLLADDGVQFQHCYVQSNWTLPSHVSLFTSLNSYRHQVYMGNEKMSPSLITLADVLRTHGYFCSGITGGGYVGEQFGFSKGFDDYKGELYKLHPAKNEAAMLQEP